MDVSIECIMKEKVDNLSRDNPVQGELVNYSGGAVLRMRYRFSLAELHRNFFSCQYFTFKIATISIICIKKLVSEKNLFVRQCLLNVLVQGEHCLGL